MLTLFRAPIRLSHLHVGVIVALVRSESLLMDVDDVVDKLVEEGRVVRDDQKCLLPIDEIVLEPNAGLEIQVIVGLVEEQQVRLTEEGTCEGNAHAPATAILLCQLGAQLLHAKAQTCEDRRCSCLGPVRVDVT
eukprot:Mycagemm_TRINITY_DN10306_c1_g3::TRINITY_DN10306_c1_g3_i1::g.1179::m.1179 type:complete len:134 gc:universal TRINITY_DN10306_c1_g3_i1:870-1271(+)